MNKLHTVLIAVAMAAKAAIGAESEYLPQPLVWDENNPKSELNVSAEVMAADRNTGALTATGHVRAVAYPVMVLTDEVRRDENGKWTFSDPSTVTTCTNTWDELHWCAHGKVDFLDRKYLLLRNMWFKLFDVPVLWIPVWYYPMDTDYGLRFMPGYTSRWGMYLMTKYVYPIVGDTNEGHWGLKGNTRLDLRTENGVALGQNIYWSLGEYGTGKFRVYYAWDEDYDRYRRHWNNSNKWNYQNWGSTVDYERYALTFDHEWEPTERDRVRLYASYLSDSQFSNDFLRPTLFSINGRYSIYSKSEAVWEHYENSWAGGLTFGGPLNEFYEGVSHLPEAYLDFMPMKIFNTPFNWESQSRFGLLNRDYGKIGSATTSIPFKYKPGPWADYQAARFDTYQRVTLPMKFKDLVSVVPRIGYHGTFWSDSGIMAGPGEKAVSLDKAVARSIIEGGITFSMRGRADFDNGLTHIIEPYFDVLCQEAEYSGLHDGARPYIFDSVDASFDWLDQFAGRSRNLPYSWDGVVPGVRNTIMTKEYDGTSRRYFDIDIYGAVQFNDTEWTDGNKYHHLTKDVADPNYGKDNVTVVPGIRARWLPTKKTIFSMRTEYDFENNTLAYANVQWAQNWSDKLSSLLTFVRRNHRYWDYSSTMFLPNRMKTEDFNWPDLSYLSFEMEYELCDQLAIGPEISIDCNEHELNAIGGWIDFRTDCLGFRFLINYVNDYERLDGSIYDHDWSFGFMIYLRAFGPDMMTPMGD